jgi:dTDP-4-dehydrorhamnose reductase
MQKTILVIGANGMFGLDAAEIFAAENYQVIKATRTDFDITNLGEVEEFFDTKLNGKKIDFAINTAAYAKVDEAQSNSDLAFAVNAQGAKNIAIVTAKKNIPLFYISTDYVFDGTKNKLYEVADALNPTGVYGASKAQGEENTRQNNAAHYIVRTSWLYGQYGKNFVDTMLKIAQSQKVIKVVNDQFGCPTWTHDLAYGIKALIEKNAEFGTYQICGLGVTSWFEFAKKIFEIAKIDVEVIPVTTDEFPRPCKRPQFSAMNNDSLCAPWQESLEKYLTKRLGTGS